ncbi:MAG: heme ABC transporter ATP-binding protein, partial [Chloroflexi bacterium]
MSLYAEQLTVEVNGHTLLDSVSLMLEAGRIVAVIGPNGAGKSTLLRALSGELPPSRGKVYIDGRPLNAWKRRELARIRAVLPQNSSLSFGFTAQEVVLMGRTPHLRGGERPVDYSIGEQAMQLTATAHLAHRAYTTLSGGERQRVQLARVLAQIWEGEAPRYLLLDEPTNNLDLSHQHGTLSIARQFTKRGVGVLAVLHDLNLAAQYADTVLILKEGRSLARGTPQTVLTPELIQLTFNLPVMVQSHPCYNCPLIIPMPSAEWGVQSIVENLYE